ncbi:MAG TPA: DinB family protein [Bacteroidia bacterium]|jgi:hypothetical protein|nr:DinB family protein [Bacteroidia bacterium]
MTINRPNSSDAPSWYSRFFDLVPGDDLIAALQNNKEETLQLIDSIPASAGNIAYAPGKWTLKQAFIHLCDEERYYCYKAFCYSRRSDVNLEVPMGELYTKDFNAGHRTLEDIRQEFSAVRDSTITLFSTLTPEMLDFKDFPGKEVYTARSLGWFAVGHNRHHCDFIRKNYLK